MNHPCTGHPSLWIPAPANSNHKRRRIPVTVHFDWRREVGEAYGEGPCEAAPPTPRNSD